MSDNSFNLSFYVLCVVLLWMALRGIMRGQAVFEYPTLAAMMGLAWVVPQGIELESNPNNPYESGAFWLYVTACFLLIFCGFRAGFKRKSRRIARAPDRELPSINMKRMLVAAAGLTAVGQFATLRMSGIDTSGMGGQWTGVITMWALLSKANGFGLCLAVLVFARTRSVSALVIAIVAGMPILTTALLGVRREALFDIIILTAGAWYISKNRFPPRIGVITLLLIGTVILNSTGDIRGQVLSGQGSFFSVVTSKNLYSSFDFFNLGQGSASEVGQAQYDFAYMNQTWDWEYGANYWNALVSQYIPAFLVGRQIKDSLIISTISGRLRSGDAEGFFSMGSTRTGFSDSYGSFGIFGMLAFGTIAYYLGVIYASAKASSMYGQYLYLVLLAEGVKAITHSTSEFLQALPFTLILSFLALQFSRKKRSRMSQSTNEISGAADAKRPMETD
jgi:hypothetical protein